MAGARFDVLVAGSGPAGSIAALVLARGGASVALVDKSPFPRDKACGDLIGPRGVQLLAEAGLDLPAARPVSDMVVVGPTGRRVQLPCYEGETYPGHALAVPRAEFDAVLHTAAVEAGAVPMHARVADPLLADNDDLDGFVLSTGARVRADTVIGADGANSRVAQATGLVDATRVLSGFALRTYVTAAVDAPHIVFRDERPWRAFPGYGWVFPGLDGRANVGIGVGVLGDRRSAARAVNAFESFTQDLRRFGIVDIDRPEGAPLGGWLKMGMVGTRPTGRRVLLVGDAAGLVNPLQGEGISQAMGSARAAAEAILADPGRPAPRYRQFLASTHARYLAPTAAVQRVLLGRPRAMALTSRAVTAPGVGRAIAGGWAIYWNDLLAGATKSRARRLATIASGIGRAATASGATRSWFAEQLGD